MSVQPDIIYTKVDEAPELASGSFLPIIQSFAKAAGVTVGTKDISLAGRILAQFPDKLKPEQRQPDDLALLGEMVMTARMPMSLNSRISVPRFLKLRVRLMNCNPRGMRFLTTRKIQKMMKKRTLKPSTTK